MRDVTRQRVASKGKAAKFLLGNYLGMLKEGRMKEEQWFAQGEGAH